MKDALFKVRLTEAEKTAWIEAAKGEGMKPSEFVRAAVAAAITRRPFLKPDELDELVALRRELNAAGVNLNTLLREVHLEQNGVRDHGPRLTDYMLMRDQLSQALARTTRFLAPLEVADG